MKKIAVGFVIFIVTLICIPLSFQVIYQAQSPETDFNPPQSLAITKEQNEEENEKTGKPKCNRHIIFFELNSVTQLLC